MSTIKKSVKRWVSRDKLGWNTVEFWKSRPYINEDGTWVTHCDGSCCFTDMDADKFLEIFGWVPKPGECFEVTFE
jgi:hypothetical protein